MDFRRLNSHTPQVLYQMPSLDDILAKAGEARVLSKFQMFYQLLVDEECRDLTTFWSPFGKFRFKRMPFGLKNAPAHFQHMVEKVLRSCSEFTLPYIDDILIFSASTEEHLEHIGRVLGALREAGLTARPSKCQWGMKYLTYLGHESGKGKLAIPENRVVALRAYKKPKSQKDMRAFLGAIGYYRRFIHDFAKLSSVLTPSISPKASKSVR